MAFELNNSIVFSRSMLKEMPLRIIARKISHSDKIVREVRTTLPFRLTLGLDPFNEYQNLGLVLGQSLRYQHAKGLRMTREEIVADQNRITGFFNVLTLALFSAGVLSVATDIMLLSNQPGLLRDAVRFTGVSSILLYLGALYKQWLLRDNHISFNGLLGYIGEKPMRFRIPDMFKDKP